MLAVYTLNVDTQLHLDSTSATSPHIIDTLNDVKNSNPNVVNFFGISEEHHEKYVLMLSALDYNVISVKYNVTETGHFYYVTGITKNYFVRKYYPYLLTSNAIKENVMINHEKNNEIFSLIVEIITPDEKHVLISVNHWSFDITFQKECGEKLSSHLTSWIQQHPDIKIVCCGGFGTLPIYKDEYIQPLINSQFRQLVDPVTKSSFVLRKFKIPKYDRVSLCNLQKLQVHAKKMNPSRQRLAMRFLYYKFFQLHKESTCDLLDHVFIYGFDSISSVKILAPDRVDFTKMKRTTFKKCERCGGHHGFFSKYFATMAALNP